MSILNYKQWSLSSLKYRAGAKSTSILETAAFCSSRNIKWKLPSIIPAEDTHKNALHFVSVLFPCPHMHKAICFFIPQVSYSMWSMRCQTGAECLSTQSLAPAQMGKEFKSISPQWVFNSRWKMTEQLLSTSQKVYGLHFLLLGNGATLTYTQGFSWHLRMMFHCGKNSLISRRKKHG